MQTLEIGLVGNGRMGQEIARLAKTRGHHIAAIFEEENPFAHGTDMKIDVLIDFSVPSAVVQTVDEFAASKVQHLVIGTTGWHDQLTAIRRKCEKQGKGVIHASNFAIGMNVMFRIASYAAAIFDKLPEYDPFIHEFHHTGKKDSPSGTALTLAEIVLDKTARKGEIQPEKSGGTIKPEQLHVTSTRAGKIPGTHVVGFDSEADTIELKHTARGRQGFALGAIYAAEWLHGRTGFFEIHDMMNELAGKI